MARATYKSLLEDLRNNDSRSFREVLQRQGLPQDEHWYDYELLVRGIRMNRKRMVAQLLEKKCRVVASTAGSNSPLHMAVEKLGWCAIVEKMLMLGARVTDVNGNGDTVLHVAFKHGASERVIDLLLRRYLAETTEDVFDSDGLGFMHIACTRPSLGIVKEFFDTGKADMYGQVSRDCARSYAGYAPLHFAVAHGRHEMARFLCQYDAEIYQQDREGRTPVHLALERRDLKMIDCILYYDCRHDNYVSNMGLSHFMAACALGEPNTVEQYMHVAEESRCCSTSVRSLLNGRAKDVAGYEFAGYTAMHLAAEFGHFHIVKGLLQIGAQYLVVTSEGLTPYALAERQQHRDICWLFHQWVEYIESQMSIQVASGPDYVDIGCRQGKLYDELA